MSGAMWGFRSRHLSRGAFAGVMLQAGFDYKNTSEHVGASSVQSLWCPEPLNCVAGGVGGCIGDHSLYEKNCINRGNAQLRGIASGDSHFVPVSGGLHAASNSNGMAHLSDEPISAVNSLCPCSIEKELIGDTLAHNLLALRGHDAVLHISNIADANRCSTTSYVHSEDVVSFVLPLLVEPRVSFSKLDVSFGTFNLPALCGDLIFSNPAQYSLKQKAYERLVVQNQVMCFQEAHCDLLDYEALRDSWSGSHVGPFLRSTATLEDSLPRLTSACCLSFRHTSVQKLFLVEQWPRFWLRMIVSWW